MTNARIMGVELPPGYRLYMTPSSQYYWSLGSDHSAWIGDKMQAIFCAYHHADLVYRQSLPRKSNPTTLDRE